VPDRDEPLYRAAFDHAPIGMALVAPDGRWLRVNRALCRIVGYAERDLLALGLGDLHGPATDPAAAAALARALAAGEGCVVELLSHRRDGSAFWNELSLTPVRGGDGATAHFVAVVRDVSARQAAEEALRRSEARYQGIAHHVPGMVFQLVAGSGGRIEWPFVSEGAREIFGVEPERIQAAPDLLLAWVHPEDRDGLLASLRRAADGAGHWEWEGRVVLPGGEERSVHGVARPGRAAGGGSAWDGVLLDVTERVAAEAVLKQSEQRLLQAQKFEAVGRLAGGVAHDFNNLLTAIRGNAELLLMDLPEADPAREDVDEIRRAADRAAGLTRQLLAFSRRQVLQPRVLDLNAVVAEMEKMLRRVIGEDVELVTRPDPALARVHADPGQLEQVILNLALNARDAMPQGGRLVVETANDRLDESLRRRYPYVVPGAYARLSVADSGTGMDAATLERAFEPFFTTKAAGRGTGLGLSTVYGIVKQSGGFIWIDSAPGAGTSVRMYFPPVDAPADADGAAPPPRRALPRGAETVLLVEDEEPVRHLARRILERAGYTVLEAGDGEEALGLASRHRGPVHLLVTDVVMPRMGGRELAARLAEARRGLRVLYVSGYNDEAVARHGVLDPGAGFIGKPFTPDAFAEKVRSILDGSTKTD
jgi:PAS domain S-box-containing protein